MTMETDQAGWLRLQHRVCVVTGAASGIGRAVAQVLAARGARLALIDKNAGQLDAVAAQLADAGGEVLAVACDTSDEARLQAAAARVERELGAACMLVNNAGVLHSGERFGHLQQALLEDSLSTNAVGPLLLVQVLAPLLRDGDGQHSPVIANLSSQLGSIASVTRFGTPGYAISKAAQNMATAQLAQALAPRGIVVLALHPGWVQTDMGGEKAPDAPADVVAGMLRLIDAATPAQSGGFFDWRGEALPW